MSIVSIILAVIALGILILVHELGHFLAAKLCGVYVERFSIGFGPRLFSWKKGDTEYCLSAIPLGGYVKLHRMLEEEEAIEGKESEAFFNKSYPKKMLIITAGVIFNMLFAVLLLSSVFLIGYKAHSPVVYNVAAGSPGAVAGFLTQDRVLSVNNQRVRSWEEFLSVLESDRIYPVDVAVDRHGKTVLLNLAPEFAEYTTAAGEKAMLAETGMSVLMEPVIGTTMTGYPADKAGIKAGDKVISIAGQPIKEWQDIGATVRAYFTSEPLDIVVNRNGEELAFKVTPKENETTEGKNFLLGISAPSGDIILREAPWAALLLGGQRTLDITKAIYVGIGQLVTGKVSRDNIGGPILIVQEGSNSAKAGIAPYLLFTALISINLGVLNLLPIPILDGGHAVVFTYERLTSRRMGAGAREKGQMIGLFLLGCLMVFAFYNDITRFFR